MDAIKRRSGTNGTGGTYVDGPRPGVLEHFERFSEVLGSRRRRLTADADVDVDVGRRAGVHLLSRRLLDRFALVSPRESRVQHKGRARLLAARDGRMGGGEGGRRRKRTRCRATLPRIPFRYRARPPTSEMPEAATLPRNNDRHHGVTLRRDEGCTDH